MADGEQPASIWQLTEMRQLQIDTVATTFAMFQCEFGATTSKPTRFLSNIPWFRRCRYSTWPKFTDKRQYRGPLPVRCVHKFDVKKLIGKDKSGKWITSASAAYPPQLCQFLATAASVLRKGESDVVWLP